MDRKRVLQRLKTNVSSIWLAIHLLRICLPLPDVFGSDAPVNMFPDFMFEGRLHVPPNDLSAFLMVLSGTCAVFLRSPSVRISPSSFLSVRRGGIPFFPFLRSPSV